MTIDNVTVSLKYIRKSRTFVAGGKQRVIYMAYYLDSCAGTPASMILADKTHFQFNITEVWSPSDFKSMKLPHSVILSA